MSIEYVWLGTTQEAEKYSKRSGHWIVANIDQQIGWPEQKTIVIFRAFRILLLPGGSSQYPGTAIMLQSDLSEAEARKLISHFLSSLCWAEGRAIRIAHWSGGGRPYQIERSGFGLAVRSKFRITYLPDPQTKDARLALAFYREAVSLDHTAYSFLSYYKIINMRYAKGEWQKAWIRRTLASVTAHEARKRLDKLLSQNIDVAKYLYESCRCAIAHAGVSPTIDPENIEDGKRLRSDLPLIRALAELMIEEHFGVKTPSTIENEHLYELGGFKAKIPVEVVQRLQNRSATDHAEVPLPEKVAIRLWGRPSYRTFETLIPSVSDIRNGMVVVTCTSESGHIALELGLDFPEERLVFDPINGVMVHDDGSPDAAEAVADLQLFLGHYFANGALEVWDMNKTNCLGRCDPFIPTDVDLRATVQSFEEASTHCLQAAEARRVK